MSKAQKKQKQLILPLGQLPPYPARWVMATGNNETNLWLRKSAVTGADRKRYGLRELAA